MISALPKAPWHSYERSLSDVLAEAVAAGGAEPLTLLKIDIDFNEGALLHNIRLRFSTDSPLRTTTGDLEAMALYAGKGAGALNDVTPAATRLAGIASQARNILASTVREGSSPAS